MKFMNRLNFNYVLWVSTKPFDVINQKAFVERSAS